MEKDTQHNRIIKYIEQNGYITTRDAFMVLGIASLPKRMSELARMGYEIQKEDTKAKNRFGESTHYVKYSMPNGKWVKSNG